MNILSTDKRARVLACLVEGCSLRSTVRMIGVAKKTVSRLLVEAGRACAAYHDKVMRNLPCRRIQVDEVWSFTYCKQKNIPEHLKGTAGMRARELFEAKRQSHSEQIYSDLLTRLKLNG